MEKIETLKTVHDLEKLKEFYLDNTYVRLKRHDKNVGISVWGNALQARAMQKALEDIKPFGEHVAAFHQTFPGLDEEVGEHFYELWGVTEEDVTDLIHENMDNSTEEYGTHLLKVNTENVIIKDLSAKASEYLKSWQK